MNEIKNKNVKNEGLILPIDDETKPDFKIDLKEYPNTQTKEYLENLADTIENNIDSIDTQLYPLLKILKKKLIRVVENGKDVSPNKDWFNVVEYEPNLIDDLQESIDTLNLFLPIKTPEIKDKLNDDALDKIKENDVDVVVKDSNGNPAEMKEVEIDELNLD